MKGSLSVLSLSLASSLFRRTAFPFLRAASRSFLSSDRWKDVPWGPDDPILGLNCAYNRDENPNKLNVGVGAYRDENGNPWVLPSVRRAEEAIFQRRDDHEYLPIEGHGPYLERAVCLAYGRESDVLREGKVAKVQTLSGTGALRLAGDFIRRTLGERTIHLPRPTWGNHSSIFATSGLQIGEYAYFDAKSHSLDFEGMLRSISEMKEGDVILLHTCAHNPSGIDPKEEEWKKISKAIQRQRVVTLFDFAYQGFASGDLERDAFPIRQFVSDGNQMLVCQSFSKNFGIYSSRTGTLSVTTESREESDRVLSQLKILIRPMYSNPPAYGAKVVAHILEDEGREREWRAEVNQMAERVIQVRKELLADLKLSGSVHNWDHIVKQIGMFCYSGLSPAHVDRLLKEYSIYMTRDGRIAMCSLSTNRVAYLASAIAEVTKGDAI